MIAKLLARVVAPVAIIGLSVLCAAALVLARPDAEKRPASVRVAPVEVYTIAYRDEPARIMATGVVSPSRQVSLIPEVGGRITWVSDLLVPGAFVAKGTELARIDGRDYALAIEGARATVHQAELELELERGRQVAAAREWELLGNSGDGSSSPMALRKPHLAVAEQSLVGAQSTLDRARISLGRTHLTAPFDSLVLDERIDVGQVVSPGTSVATLIGADSAWVKVSVPVEVLPALDLPRAGQGGSAATVTQSLGAVEKVVRTGRVIQLLAELDAQTRTAQLLIEIDEPIRTDELPMLPGAYVDVEIRGRTLPDALYLPRTAVTSGDTVWLVVDEKLSRRDVRVIWREDDRVAVEGDLPVGALVVASPVAAPVEGMPVVINPTPGDESARAVAPSER